jgi:cyclic pyranopterin phosphate synthase
MHTAAPVDQLARPLGVLRLSLTARCNLACPYCLPDGQEPEGVLTLEQRVAVVAASVALGVSTLRLTGGEPLLNPQLEQLIEAVQPLRRQGLMEIALTTNGSLLSLERARQLKRAGLDRITLSLDGTDADVVARMAGLPAEGGGGERLLQRVLDGLDHARKAGFMPARGELKLNAVIQRQLNEHQLLPLAQLARDRGVELRLIETMDVGNRNGWSPEVVVPAAEMIAILNQAWPLQPLGRSTHGTAKRWRYGDGGGVVAVVASITEPFCGDCNRLRVTADGIAYTCLFAAANEGLDLRAWLEPGASNEALQQALARLWRERHNRYSEERSALRAKPNSSSHAEMAYLGG